MRISKFGFLLSVFLASLLSACSENIDFQGHSPEQYNSVYSKVNKVETRHLIIDLKFKGAEKTLLPKDVYDLQSILGGISPNAVDSITLKAAKGMRYRNARVQNVKNLLSKFGYKLPVKVATEENIDSNNIVIDVLHVAVVAPDCPDWRKSPVTTFSNTPHTNYGCAAAVNLGLMIDNPRDLLRGRDSRVSNAERADKALSDYRSGTHDTSSTATATTATGN